MVGCDGLPSGENCTRRWPPEEPAPSFGSWASVQPTPLTPRSILCSGLEVGVTSEPDRLLSALGLSQVRNDAQTSEQIHFLLVPQGEKDEGTLEQPLE